jgi:hypothetical protein
MRVDLVQAGEEQDDDDGPQQHQQQRGAVPSWRAY